MANEADGTRQFEPGIQKLRREIMLEFYGKCSVEQAIEDVLRRELGPLLEAMQNVVNAHDLHPKGALRTELDKWRK